MELVEGFGAKIINTVKEISTRTFIWQWRQDHVLTFNHCTHILTVSNYRVCSND